MSTRNDGCAAVQRLRIRDGRRPFACLQCARCTSNLGLAAITAGGAGAVPYGWGTGCIGPNDVLLEDFQPALHGAGFFFVRSRTRWAGRAGRSIPIPFRAIGCAASTKDRSPWVPLNPSPPPPTLAIA